MVVSTTIIVERKWVIPQRDMATLCWVALNLSSGSLSVPEPQVLEPPVQTSADSPDLLPGAAVADEGQVHVLGEEVAGVGDVLGETRLFFWRA